MKKYNVYTTDKEIAFTGSKRQCREWLTIQCEIMIEGQPVCWQWVDEEGNHFYDVGKNTYIFNDWK